MPLTAFDEQVLYQDALRVSLCLFKVSCNPLEAFRNARRKGLISQTLGSSTFLKRACSAQSDRKMTA